MCYICCWKLGLVPLGVFVAALWTSATHNSYSRAVEPLLHTITRQPNGALMRSVLGVVQTIPSSKGACVQSLGQCMPLDSLFNIITYGIPS